MFGMLAFSSITFGGDNAVPVLIDVRTEAEWVAGHLEGAVLIPYDRIEQGITAVVPDKKSKILLYCRSGRRSGIAVETLKNVGYQDLTNLGSMENAAKELNRRIVK
ncbi:MAG: rhodanese-like domain-containing protein [Geobacter sp.]|nr:rhodanese-like domain-containing protein [Geobacter sp.]